VEIDFSEILIMITVSFENVVILVRISIQQADGAGDC